MAVSFQGEVADFVVQAYESQSANVQAAILASEGGLQKFLVAVFANIHAGGIAGLILPYLESGIEGFVAQLIAKYTTQQLFDMVDALLKQEAKNLGG